MQRAARCQGRGGSACPCSRASGAELAHDDLRGEPVHGEVAAVHLEQRTGVGPDGALRSRRGACGSSRRPRASRAPLFAMISCTRKLPPISTSSPRERIASRPSASVLSASTSAAAQLLTTSASSAPVSSRSSEAQCDVARSARALLEIELQVGVAGPPRARSRRAPRRRAARGRGSCAARCRSR